MPYFFYGRSRWQCLFTVFSSNREILRFLLKYWTLEEMMWALVQGIKRYHSSRDYKWETGNGIGLPKSKHLPYGHLQQTAVIQALTGNNPGHPWKQSLSRAQTTFFWMALLVWDDSQASCLHGDWQIPPFPLLTPTHIPNAHTEVMPADSLSWQCASSPLQRSLQRGTGVRVTFWFVLQPLGVGYPSHSSTL